MMRVLTEMVMLARDGFSETSCQMFTAMRPISKYSSEVVVVVREGSV